MRHVAIALPFLVSVACGSSSSSTPAPLPGIAADSVAPVSANLADVVAVFADHVVVPAAGFQDMLNLTPGQVLAVAGSTTNPSNPTGFLRIVAGVTTSGSNLVIATTPASLTDAIQQGELAGAASSDGSMQGQSYNGVKPLDIGGLVSGEKDFSGEVILSQTDSSSLGGEATVNENVTIKQGSLSFSPNFDTDLQISNKQIQLFKLLLSGTVQANFQLQIDVTANGSLEVDAWKELKSVESKKRLITLPRVNLPVQFIGPVPVWEGLEIDVDFGCTFSFQAELHLQAGLQITGSFSAGGQYQNGAWQALGDGPKLTMTPTWDPQVSGDVSLVCYIEPEVGVLFYDVVGPYLGIGPYLSLEEDNGKWGLYPGAAAEVGGDFELFGKDVAFGSLEIWSWQSNTPLLGSVGAADAGADGM